MEPRFTQSRHLWRHGDAFGDSFFDVTHKTFLYDYLSSIWPEAPNGPVEGNDLSQLVYACSACYSPNVDNPPFYVDLPIAFPSGELIQEVWDRWLSFDPVVNWRDRLDNLRRLTGILLDVGSNDDHHMQWGHRLLSHHLLRGRYRPRGHREHGQPRRALARAFPGPAPVVGAGTGEELSRFLPRHNRQLATGASPRPIFECLLEVDPGGPGSGDAVMARQ